MGLLHDRDYEGFEWDEGNSGKNFKKHGITDKEIEQVFLNDPYFTSIDLKHSDVETRERILGKTDSGKSVFAVFTTRGNRIRDIHARWMNKEERKQYDEEITRNS
ncbi:MAG TPA: BrnT family toxin [Candidatus Kapabacteria bacterium]|jgi:hypothetical protein|nr:BrnT family toxin [Candidatus Kapabacteria bacterium]